MSEVVQVLLSNLGSDAVNNTSVGIGALNSINSSATSDEADNNTCVGYNAEIPIITGYQNTCIGSGDQVQQQELIKWQ